MMSKFQNCLNQVTESYATGNHNLKDVLSFDTDTNLLLKCMFNFQPIFEMQTNLLS